MYGKEKRKPLAKVEELEEANYNKIDDILNNMPPKKEPYLEYYVSECDEYYDMAKMYRGDDIEEILARYRAIIEDPTLDYHGNGMGFICRDLDNSLYDETEITQLSVGRVSMEIIWIMWYLWLQCLPLRMN